jgi:hypothetical protein
MEEDALAGVLGVVLTSLWKAAGKIDAMMGLPPERS